MKKKLILYITFLLFLSNLVFYLSTISFETKKLNKEIAVKEKNIEIFISKEVKNYVDDFFSGKSVLFLPDKENFEEEIQNINMFIKTRKKWTNDELKDIIKDTHFNNIYFVDPKGKITLTSNKEYQDKEIKKIYNSVTNKVLTNTLATGEFNIGESVPKESNGKLMLLSYYSPKYSNYIIITEIKFWNYIKSNYAKELKNRLLIDKLSNNNTSEFVKEIDVFYKNKKSWSLFNEGTALNDSLNKVEMMKLFQKKILIKKNAKKKNYFKIDPKNYQSTKFKEIKIKKNGYSYDIILKLSYDFSSQALYLSNSLKRVLKITIILLVISIFFLFQIFYIFINKKLRPLLSSLKKMRLGEYNIEDIEITGNDEISEIAETINKLKKEILVREKKLIRLAITDELTKLYNRKYLFHRLNDEIDKATKHNSTFSIILFDIDYFKKINDTYGHQTGDKVLMEIGKILIKELKKNILAARYGGEEFVLLLSQTKLSDAYEIAEQFRIFLEHRKWNEENLKVTISSGVKEYPIGKNLDSFLADVDSLLYKAKQNGRNRTEV